MSPSDIAYALHEFKFGKSTGNYNINVEHFQYASKRLTVVLAILMTPMIIDGYIAQCVLDTVLIDVVKNKSGDTIDSSGADN